MTRRSRMSGAARVGWLTTAVAIAAVTLSFNALGYDRVDAPLQIPWPLLVAAFYIGELAVVHLRFRRDAHSFSMSEVPLVIGLFLASPLELLTAQLVGNVLALVLSRRQPPLKLAFNVSQFTLQAVLALTVFHGIVSLGRPDGPAGWVGALVATLIAVLTGDTLVNTAIRLSGGRLGSKEMIQVLAFGVLAAEMNTTLALIGIVVLWANPGAVWLTAGPMLVLFLAYRAYTLQREEGTRLESLYEATRILHQSPQLESALVSSATHARHMFEADVVEIVLLPEGPRANGLRTTSGPGDHVEAMAPVPAGSVRWISRVDGRSSQLVGERFERRPGVSCRNGIVAVLRGDGGVIGYMLVADRISDISDFGVQDQMLLEAFAQQVGVSIENSRLGDSLAQVTELKERLEELVRSKDKFVASVSHELRTPLTAVVGLAEELKTNRGMFSDNELEELVAIIAGQSGELANIVEDLLVGARADIGTLVVKPEPIDVRSQIEFVLQSGHGTLATAEPEIRGSAPLAVADPLRFRQIIRNMLTNALRYGGDKVFLELAGSDGAVTVSVIDDGPGVPEGHADRIFEPYERAHTPGTQPDSVGLGLAVSRQLARLMGGDLEYRRKNGLTEFTVSMPAAAATAVVRSAYAIDG